MSARTMRKDERTVHRLEAEHLTKLARRRRVYDKTRPKGARRIADAFDVAEPHLMAGANDLAHRPPCRELREPNDSSSCGCRWARCAEVARVRVEPRARTI